MVSSTEVLKEWAAVDGRYVRRDLARTPPGLVLRGPDGREVVFNDAQGRKGYIFVPDEMIDDFLRQSYVRRDDGGAYWLTRDGIARGRS
jgi:hypothetical protein